VTADIRDSSFRAACIGAFRGSFACIRLWKARARQRRRLSRLDAYLLRDIGVSAEDAAREAAKPFWRD